MRVSGEREREVDLVRNLEHSQRFLTPRLVNETAQTQQPGSATPVAFGGTGGVEFDILSGYNPLPLPAKDAAKDSTTATPNSAGGGR
jgi:type IV pilus assembly protein PilN